MEVEQLIGLGVVILLALLAAWLVWTCMCKGHDDGDEEDVESHVDVDDEVKSVNSRTKVISSREIRNHHNLSLKEDAEDILMGGGGLYPHQVLSKSSNGKARSKSSCYVQGSTGGLADPYGEWTRREKDVDDTEALSGIKTYRKSPLMSRSAR